MDALDKVLKPKTKRAKRFLEKREPKLSENIKNAMLIKGGNANATVTQVLRDVYALKKPYGVLYKRKTLQDHLRIRRHWSSFQRSRTVLCSCLAPTIRRGPIIS